MLLNFTLGTKTSPLFLPGSASLGGWGRGAHTSLRVLTRAWEADPDGQTEAEAFK